MNKFLSRKFGLALLVVGVACWARAYQHVDGSQFVTLVLGAYGGYAWVNYQQSKS
jgi:hypothetical protein